MRYFIPCTQLYVNQEHMVLKLDMSKAYYRLEMDFIRAIMAKLNFDLRWINLALSNVTTKRFEAELYYFTLSICYLC